MVEKRINVEQVSRMAMEQEIRGRVPKSLKKDIQRLAKKRGERESVIIREALREYRDRKLAEASVKES